MESYLEDVNKLQEKLKGAENELDCEREKGKGMVCSYRIDQGPFILINYL